MIIIRAFKAIDEPQTCERFLEGHRRVLEEFNLENITSNTPRWITHEHTYVIIGEYQNELIGGIRLQLADGKFPLPVEDAVGHFDPKIHTMVNKYRLSTGVGEVCGLWNSRKFAPNVGLTVLLTLAGVSVCDQLGVKSMFAICAGYTLAGARRIGFEIEKSLGNNGEFVYPNSNFVARVLRMNTETLDASNAQHRLDILALRKNRHLVKKILVNKEETDLVHELEIKNVSTLLQPAV